MLLIGFLLPGYDSEWEKLNQPRKELGHHRMKL
jgi:hypothetical protein